MRAVADMAAVFGIQGTKCAWRFARVEYVCGRITPRVLQGLDDSILNWEWVFFWVSFEEVAR